MQLLLQSYKTQVLILLFIWLVSMVLSAEFVLTMSMIGLTALTFIQMEMEGPHVRWTWRKGLKEQFQRFLGYKAWLWVSTPFLLVLISALWSSDLDYTLERLRIKLPFLVLPFAFAVMPTLRKREIYTILFFLLVLMSVISVFVLLNFVIHFQSIMDEIGRGGHLPTPSNHIRFSLMLALSIVGGLALWADRFYLRHSSERYLIAAMTIFLFLFIHVLSVRSGVLTLYLALFVLALYFILMRRKILNGLVVVFLLAALPVATYYTVPSFRLKVNYARWDYLQFLQGKGGGYPDSERLISIRVGLDIGRQSPLLGVGAGDLKRLVKKVYDEQYAGRYHVRMPHNQFVTVFAGTGIFGLVFFLIGFFFPLLHRKHYRQPLFLAFHAVILASFLAENTIENNFGVSLYLFFLLIGLHYFYHQETHLSHVT